MARLGLPVWVARLILHPQWKNGTFAIGLALLLAGAGYAPDWDVGISLVMAAFTYLTAGFTLQTLLTRAWRRLPLALLYTWWTVDGCYWLYWTWVDPRALVMRDVNWPASLCLYFACALVWKLPEVVETFRRPA